VRACRPRTESTGWRILILWFRAFG
jgi:hypothetical protein